MRPPPELSSSESVISQQRSPASPSTAVAESRSIMLGGPRVGITTLVSKSRLGDTTEAGFRSGCWSQSEDEQSHSAEAVTRQRNHACLQLASQTIVVKTTANQDDLILALARPVRVIDCEPLACQVKHVTAFALIEPEHALGPEHLCGELIVKKILKFPQSERGLAAEGKRCEAFNREMVG